MTDWLERRDDWLGRSEKPSKKPKKKQEEPIFGEAVEYIPMRCPVVTCRSKRLRCYKTMPKDEIDGRIWRYHLCMACGCKFPSIEEDEE